jgi:preprotein translocase subunit SecD
VLALMVIRPEIRTSGPAGDSVQIQLGGGTQAAEVMRERLARADVRDVDVSVAGDEVTLSAPPELRATIAALAVPGHFGIYDWETSVAGPHGPSPADATVTGGEDAGHAAALSLHAAAARAAALDAPYVTVVRAQRQPDRAYVLARTPALTNRDLASAQPDRDPQAGESVVHLQFTADGAGAFSRLTRAVAHRGAERGANQHLALVVDNRILSVPYIDHRVAPEGLGGQEGAQISGELTPRDAHLLAAVLSTGPLP